MFARFNPLHANFPFIYPMKTSEMEHWREMGEVKVQ